MKKTFLNHEKPLLTAMLQYSALEPAIEAIRNGLSAGAEAFGLQVESLEKEYQPVENYKKLFAEMQGKPCYVTIYRVR